MRRPAIGPCFGLRLRMVHPLGCARRLLPPGAPRPRRFRGELLGCSLTMPRDGLPDQLLDRPQVLRLLAGHEGEGMALPTGPPGTPDAVDVVLRVDRGIVVED